MLPQKIVMVFLVIIGCILAIGVPVASLTKSVDIALFATLGGMCIVCAIVWAIEIIIKENK